MKATEPPVVAEETFDVAPDVVWKAISEIDRMKQWYFEGIPDFQAKVGFKTRFNVESDGRQFVHLWEVTEVIPNVKLVYAWTFYGYPGVGSVSWELSEIGGKARLKLTNRVQEDFPDHIPEFRRESCVEGWRFFINGRLKEFLAIEPR